MEGRTAQVSDTNTEQQNVVASASQENTTPDQLSPDTRISGMANNTSKTHEQNENLKQDIASSNENTRHEITNLVGKIDATRIELAEHISGISASFKAKFGSMQQELATVNKEVMLIREKVARTAADLREIETKGVGIERREIMTAINIDVLNVDEGEATLWSNAGMLRGGGGNGRSPIKPSDQRVITDWLTAVGHPHLVFFPGCWSGVERRRALPALQWPISVRRLGVHVPDRWLVEEYTTWTQVDFKQGFKSAHSAVNNLRCMFITSAIVRRDFPVRKSGSDSTGARLAVCLNKGERQKQRLKPFYAFFRGAKTTPQSDCLSTSARLFYPFPSPSSSSFIIIPLRAGCAPRSNSDPRAKRDMTAQLCQPALVASLRNKRLSRHDHRRKVTLFSKSALKEEVIMSYPRTRGHSCERVKRKRGVGSREHEGGKQARQARPKSIAQLMEWLQEEWRRIPVDVLQTLVESMPDRPNRLTPRRTRFNPLRVTSGFLHVGIVPDDAAVRRVFSGSPVTPALSFRRCSVLTSIALIGSQDLDLKSHPNIFAHLTLN
ncbi:hypothetical protein PR048_024095 [Dryococelus australis]|uniref:Transposase n=1 Tax=Dryococelus australis TaxID=614101 RepID=A0ABQ9GW14_9NEOP|nr:hypothetical protein PR048_024095 [Dryococelus australis]